MPVVQTRGCRTAAVTTGPRPSRTSGGSRSRRRMRLRRAGWAREVLRPIDQATDGMSVSRSFGATVVVRQLSIAETLTRLVLHFPAFDGENRAVHHGISLGSVAMSLARVPTPERTRGRNGETQLVLSTLMDSPEWGSVLARPTCRARQRRRWLVCAWRYPPRERGCRNRRLGVEKTAQNGHSSRVLLAGGRRTPCRDLFGGQYPQPVGQPFRASR